MELLSVPRIHRDDFQVSRWGGQPCVVLDNVRDWAALNRWQPGYLRSVIGDRDVVVRETNGPPRNIFQNLAEGGGIPFGQYFDWVLDTAQDLDGIARTYREVGDITREVCARGFAVSYYLDANLKRLSPTLLGDAPEPAWFQAAPSAVNLWCGVLGTSSGLHCDVSPNCNVQVVGTKHFILFSPGQTRKLYRAGRGTHCGFDPNLPDYERFPLARGARGWQCTLQPGESLYIPVGWYHQVTVTSGWALNVNFFWRRPFPQGLAVPALWRFLLRRHWATVQRAVTSDRR